MLDVLIQGRSFLDTKHQIQHHNSLKLSHQIKGSVFPREGNALADNLWNAVSQIQFHIQACCQKGLGSMKQRPEPFPGHLFPVLTLPQNDTRTACLSAIWCSLAFHVRPQRAPDLNLFRIQKLFKSKPSSRYWYPDFLGEQPPL